jgi:hypothetical protein
MSALGTALGFFGLSKFVQAEKPIYKYSKFFRNCDQATMDEFKDIVVLDNDGKAYKVPVIWATEDKAEAYISLVESATVAAPIEKQLVNLKIKLPLINIYRGDLFFNEKIYSYYHLTARTLYEEHMNQIQEQVVVKFWPKLKNKVGEYNLMSMINIAMRGEVFSATKWGKQSEWLTYNQHLDNPWLKHQFNLILTIEGRP